MRSRADAGDAAAAGDDIVQSLKLYPADEICAGCAFVESDMKRDAGLSTEVATTTHRAG